MDDPKPDPDFVLEEELLEAIPRRVIPTRGALLAWRIGWNVLLAIICIVYYLAASEMSDLSSLAAHGRVINGYVVAPSAETNYSCQDCDVAYTLNRNSSEPDGTFELAGCSDRRPQIGEAFQVTYLPRTPFVYRLGTIGPWNYEDCRSHWMSVGLLLVIPYLIVMWIVKRCQEAQKEILRRGVAAVANVTGRHITKSDESTSYSLTYVFHLPDGRQRSGFVSVSKEICDAYPDGRKFSVLVNPYDIYHRATPYFSISGAMIKNAPKRTFL